MKNHTTNSIRLVIGLLVAGVPATLQASPYSDAVNALHPDAYYRGEEGAGAPLDTTAGGHNLSNFFNNTYGTGPTAADGFSGMGTSNGAYQFTGPQVARSGETVGSTYIPAVGQAARTVISWVKLDSRGTADLGGSHNVWSWGLDFSGANTFTNWQLFIDEGFNPATGTGTGFQNVHLNIQGRQIVGADTPITFGPNAKWHQIAIAFEGDGTTPLGDADMYVDGVLQTTIYQDTSVIPITGGANQPGLVLGFRLGQAVGGYGLNAKVDEVSVYLQKLDAATILGLYNAAGSTTLVGDVNFDGDVNIFDINLVSANWGTPGGPTGDANGDGNVDIFDINLISANWSPAPGSAVPEPSSVALASIALGIMATWRRYSARKACSM